MKFIFLLTLIASTFALHSSKHLEIHIFDMRGGDSQLLVFPSGYSILIDLGDRNDEAKYTKHVAERLEAILGKKKSYLYNFCHLGCYQFGIYLSERFR